MRVDSLLAVQSLFWQRTLWGGVLAQAMLSVTPEARKAQALSTAVLLASSAVEPLAPRHLVWPRNSMHTSQEYPPRLKVENRTSASTTTTKITTARVVLEVLFMASASATGPATPERGSEE